MSLRHSDLARSQISWDISVLSPRALLAPLLTVGGVLRLPWDTELGSVHTRQATPGPSGGPQRVQSVLLVAVGPGEKALS